MGDGLGIWFGGGLAVLAVMSASCFWPQAVDSAAQPVVEVEFTNAKLQPSHWVIRLDADGTGVFDSKGGSALPSDANQIAVGDLHRAIHLSDGFTQHVFQMARARKLFAFPCESHMKVAFQGTKRLSYSGPEGSGSCEYNYSKDREIQALGESFLAVEATVLSGARMEKLLQHDRLGLDQELESLVTQAHEGNAIEMGTIAETLTKIAGDEQVLERARRKARLLLSASPS